jgi:hypothetical protein
MTIGGVTPARNAVGVGGSIVHDMGAVELFADVDAKLSSNQSHEAFDAGLRIKF